MTRLLLTHLSGECGISGASANHSQPRFSRKKYYLNLQCIFIKLQPRGVLHGFLISPYELHFLIDSIVG